MTSVDLYRNVILFSNLTIIFCGYFARSPPDPCSFSKNHISHVYIQRVFYCFFLPDPHNCLVSGVVFMLFFFIENKIFFYGSSFKIKKLILSFWYFWMLLSIDVHKLLSFTRSFFDFLKSFL